MKALVSIARTLVGSLFVVSGLIKANDTLGFSYKMVDYFEVFGMPGLGEYALPFAVIIAVLEVLLGFATLLGTRMRLTSWVLLLLIAFFTWLTFYSAYYDVVKDCGCFGDALKLTPWQSFTKDVVLLALVLIIFLNRCSVGLNDAKAHARILPGSLVLILLFSGFVLNWWFPLIFSLLVFVLTLLIQWLLGRNARTELLQVLRFVVLTALFTFYCLHYLPIRDFRPYAEGKSIPEQMTVAPEDRPVYSTVFVYKEKESGKEVSIPQDSLGNYDLEQYEYVERSTEVVKEGKEPAIDDFSIETLKGEGMTEKIIGDTAEGNETGPVFLVVAYDLHKTRKAPQDRLNQLYEKAEEDGHRFYGVTSTTGDKVDSFRHEHQIMYPYLVADGILLKTIVRSNPGLVLLEDGKVLGKWPSTALPSYERIEKSYLQ